MIVLTERTLRSLRRNGGDDCLRVGYRSLGLRRRKLFSGLRLDLVDEGVQLIHRRGVLPDLDGTQRSLQLGVQTLCDAPWQPQPVHTGRELTDSVVRKHDARDCAVRQSADQA